MEHRFLGNVNNPDELKQLNIAEAEILCQEIRDELVHTVSSNGGHLASNLGVVELTVALHRSFCAPDDVIIFDVGHQCYPHKMLTGRYESFYTLRTEKGISGFMRPSESIYDPFVTGHASNSLAAAYGMVKAKRLKGEKAFGVAVIGDGALTGGLAFEALNNIGGTKENFIVVLNDNKMSISSNVGSISRYLSKIRTKQSYYALKKFVQQCLKKLRPLYKLASKLKQALKNVIYRDSLFEGLGFKYLGPIDGHDIEELENIFKIAKSLSTPCVVHVMTVKGKGYARAEQEPSEYHGVSAFAPAEGIPEQSENFSVVCGKALLELANEDKKVCAVTAAMCKGTGLDEFGSKLPDRFFDVGIAEEFAVTFAGGLAAGGMKPYFAVYSTFLQRAYDEIIHDTAIAKLPVRFLVDRAGIVGEDGETHQGIFDIPFLSTVPNIKIYSPASYDELRGVIKATCDSPSPIAIRYPRGAEQAPFKYRAGDFTAVQNGGKIAIVTYGILSNEGLKAQKALKNLNISVDFIKLNCVYPLAEDLISLLNGYDKIYVFEECIKSGGVGEHIAGRVNVSTDITAIEDFVPAMEVTKAKEMLGLCAKQMTLKIAKDNL